MLQTRSSRSAASSITSSSGRGCKVVQRCVAPPSAAAGRVVGTATTPLRAAVATAAAAQRMHAAAPLRLDVAAGPCGSRARAPRRRAISASAAAAAAAAAAALPPSAAPHPDRPKARLAVFVSGGGSNFKAIHAACLDGRIHADVAAVVSDVPTCGGVQYAQSHGIATLTFPAPKKGGWPGLTAPELVAALTEEHRVDFVLLAGFLKLIPDSVVAAYPRRMLNIHPGLLPSFGGKGYYGERVHAAVIASGARFSGPTVHFVDAEYDTGPILAQAVVPVLPTDTPKRLAARVLQQEHRIYPEAVAALVDGRVTWRADGIPIMWSAH